MDAEEKRKQLERDILAIIEQKLNNGQMSDERARAIAKMVLGKLHPPLSLEQIFEVAPTLDDEFKELSDAVLPLLEEHDQVVRNTVSKHAEDLIKSGKLGEASVVLEKALS